MKTILFLIYSFLIVSLLFARENLPTEIHTIKLLTQRGTPQHTLININNFSSWMSWDGISGYNPVFGNAGVYYPRFTTNVIYKDGIIWGGYCNDGQQPKLRVGGQTYRSGTVPGRIISPGNPQNPNDPDVRIYRIRSDWQVVSDDELRKDAAELLNIPIAQVTQNEIDDVRAQYGTDWNEWPVNYGAPYMDHNQNGIWDPGVDEPGLLDAGQVIWCTVNDLDPSATYDLYGSPPMGMELQVTMWGYDDPPEYTSTYLRRYRIINKSGVRFDSVFVAQWSDPDIGEYINDYVGCDTLLNLGFGYNAYPYDAEYTAFGLPPAAVGYSFIQGPIIPSMGDSAYFDLKVKYDYKNLPLTSFTYFSAASAINDPELGDYMGTLKWYKMLNGYIPDNPDTFNLVRYTYGSGANAGQPTSFPLSGDPLHRLGDVDGMGNNLPTSDRRMVMSSGPFTMQPGDTQEVVMAVTGGIDAQGDNLTSLEEMKQNVRNAILEFGLPIAYPLASHVVNFPDNQHIDLLLIADLTAFSGVTNCSYTMNPQVGNEAPFTVTLYDDGQHNDGAAGDGIWANSVVENNRKYPYQGDISISHSGGQQDFPGVLLGVRLRPVPLLKDWQIIWENGKQDLSLNHNEKVRMAFSFENKDALNDITSLKITNNEFMQNVQTINYTQPVNPGQTVISDTLFMIFYGEASGDFSNHSYRVHFDHHSFVRYENFPLVPWTPYSSWRDTINVINLSGADRTITPIVCDASLLTNHDYHVTIYHSAIGDSILWRLHDLNLGQVIFEDSPVGTDINEDYPVVDGVEWKVYAEPPHFADGGNGIVEVAYAGTAIPPEGYDPTGAPFYGNTVWLDANWEGTSGGRDRYMVSTNYYPIDISTISRYVAYSNWRDFEFRFNTQGGYGIRAFTDKEIVSVPFEIWDIGVNTPDDPSDDVRMIPVLLGHSGGQWGWGVDVDPQSGAPCSERVYYFDPIDNSPGSSGYLTFENHCINNGGAGHIFIPDPQIPASEDWYANLYGGMVYPIGRTVYADLNNDGNPPPNGTVIRFNTNTPLQESDTFFVATSTVGIKNPGLIYKYSLSPNYPNPFNPVTNIKFSLAKSEKVQLEIFNILGQRVAKLVDKKMPAGEYSVKWNAQNAARYKVGSGLYFYRVTAGDFVKTRKMMLLK